MRWTTVVLLLLPLSVWAGEQPRLEPVGTVEVQADEVGPRIRMSSDGHWLVTAFGAKEDKTRGAWSFAGFALVDVRSATVLSTEKGRCLGRNTPAFSRNSRWMAWSDGPRPGATTIHKRELATGKVDSTDMETDGQDFPTVCAASDDGTRVVLAMGAGGPGDPDLALVDLEHGRMGARVRAFKEPYFSAIGYEVVLDGDLLLHHTRPPREAGGAGYRLLLSDAATGETKAALGAYVAWETPRFHLARNGATLWNGTGDFDIQESDTRTGATKTLFNAHEQLYSHFLELTVAPDERTLVAWSRGSSTFVVWDREPHGRADIEWNGGVRVLGFHADNRTLLIQGDGGIELFDIPSRKRTGRLVAGEVRLAALDPTGRTLVLGRPKQGSHDWILDLSTVGVP